MLDVNMHLPNNASGKEREIREVNDQEPIPVNYDELTMNMVVESGVQAKY